MRTRLTTLVVGGASVALLAVAMLTVTARPGELLKRNFFFSDSGAVGRVMSLASAEASVGKRSGGVKALLKTVCVCMFICVKLELNVIRPAADWRVCVCVRVGVSESVCIKLNLHVACMYTHASHTCKGDTTHIKILIIKCFHAAPRPCRRCSTSRCLTVRCTTARANATRTR